jgi:hypothetical protein
VRFAPVLDGFSSIDVEIHEDGSFETYKLPSGKLVAIFLADGQVVDSQAVRLHDGPAGSDVMLFHLRGDGN